MMLAYFSGSIKGVKFQKKNYVNYSAIENYNSV